MSISKAVLSPQGIYYFALSDGGYGRNVLFSYDLNTGMSNYVNVTGFEVDGLAFIDNTLYVSNAAALQAYSPELKMKWSKPTGFNRVEQGSNLIATQENGKNILYYAATNVVFRLDTTTDTLTKYQCSDNNIGISTISYLGNGYLLVFATVDEKKVDVIYSINVVKGTSLKLQSKKPFISSIFSCTSPLNVQTSQSATHSIISCGIKRGSDNENVVFGIVHDVSSKVPRFENIWIMPIQGATIRFASTQSNRQILMTNHSGYVILDIQSGKVVSEKNSDFANSLCKVITALNGKFYSVCWTSDGSVVSVTSDHL